MKPVFSRLSPFSDRHARGALIALSAVAMFWPHPAAAQANTVGDVMCNIFNNLTGSGASDPVADLFDAVAYIAGIFFIATGLLGFKEYSDSPGRPPLWQPLMRIIGGAALMSVPSIVAWAVSTLFGAPASGGLSVCDATAPAAASTDLGTAITNFTNNIQGPMTVMISMISFTVGVFFIVRGLMKAAKHGQERNTTTNIVTNLVIGAILVTIGQSAGIILSTIFGNDTIANSATPGASIVAGWSFVTTLGASTNFINAVAAGLDFFQLIGMIAFVRGFIIIKNAVEGTGQATMAQGFTHVFGGALALNIYQVLELFDATLGTGWL